ncbi:MAG: 50S ribosomal protein L4 [Candidatus Paceibacterota bacterium]
MEIEVYNQKGEIIEKLPLKEDVFKEKYNPDFLHQVYKMYLKNRYPVIAFTKDRSEVKGGGKKPWRQKGTGRARHGSIRSPLWVKGGVTFGPRRKEEALKVKINKKVKEKALRMVFSKKLEDKEIKVVDDLSLEDLKTKKAEEIIKNILKLDKKKAPSVLVVLDKDKEKDVKRAFRNLEYVDLLTDENLDLVEILNNKYLFLSKNTLQKIETKLS